MAIDLKKFTLQDDEYPRFDFRRVFVSRGWQYASNGHVVVRIPAPDAKDSKWTYPSKRPSVETLPWDHGQIKDEVWKPWPAVKLTGLMNLQQIDNTTIDPDYDALVRALPGVVYCIQANGKQIFFKSGELQGILMAMR